MKFTIPGEPVPKERPRRGPHGNWYTPRATKAYEDTVAYSAMAAGSKLTGPVVLNTTVYTSNRKLDMDNVLKSLADGLNGHGYDDDRQICELHMYRVWSANPRVEVELKETQETTEDP